MDIMAPPRAVKSSDGKNHNIAPDKKVSLIFFLLLHMHFMILESNRILKITP